MRFQRGQSVVEFALVLPIFFVVFFGIFYMGMIFADYMTLSNVARSSAREASISSADSTNDYRAIRTNYKSVELPLDAFILDITTTHFMIEKIGNNVKVTIDAPLNNEGAGIASVFYKLIKYTGKDISLKITYTMYSGDTSKK